MRSEFLLLYSSNILVQGKKRAAIYCLDRSTLVSIPLTFSNIIRELENSPFSKIKRKYTEQNNVFKSYVDFLIKEELAFFTNEPECFPKRSLQFNSPEIITCATVEYSALYNFSSLIHQLDDCNCKHIQVFLLNTHSTIKEITDILEATDDSTLRSINLVLNYSTLFLPKNLSVLSKRFPKLASISFCNSHKNEMAFSDGILHLYVDKEVVAFADTLPLENFLIVNHKFFFESQLANPYYNNKVFIDKNGCIKNAIRTENIFGKIQTDSLKNITTSRLFQKLWRYIPKHVKNSEFRYCLYNPGKNVEISALKNCKIISYSSE